MNRPADSSDALAEAQRLYAEGRNGEAITCLEDLLRRDPGVATAHFNLALLYKRDKRYADALGAYEQAIRLGIDHVEEVYSNAGVLLSEMRRADDARGMYERALDLDADYLPALFNLAGLLEETGDREAAVAAYRRILANDPGNFESLARIAHATRVADGGDTLIAELRAAAAARHDQPFARETLLFALGKTLDDARIYNEAYAAYHEANTLGARRMPPYDPGSTEAAIDGLIRFFDRDCISRLETASEAAPVFICGMYRSGSTLVEQILAAHSAVTAGGELDILPWLVTRHLLPYPQRLAGVGSQELGDVAAEYAAHVGQLFPGGGSITDKRPDNFLHLGLLRAMFPRARFVVTRRERRDNCLSIWFQQLGGHLNYSTDLGAASHYYGQQERLMAHWQALFPERLFTVDYDRLVRDPEPVLRTLTDFLGLAWDPACLAFQAARTAVQTASVWQVREPLHTRSSGRWRHYEAFAGDIPGW